jgi:hypothetical protein
VEKRVRHKKFFKDGEDLLGGNKVNCEDLFRTLSIKEKRKDKNM